MMSGRASPDPDAVLDARRQRIASAYREACALELAALKPGNVHQWASGHGMTVGDFIRSAEVSAGPLTEPGLGLGERIERAAAATRDAVGCNTNLGILLLCGPLVQAALQPDLRGSLHERLEQMLAEADERDTEGLFAAIRIAAPAGLGNAGEHDVAAAATAAPLDVMSHAAGRDLIARQYTTGYADLFGRGVRMLEAFEQRWSDPAWSTVALYMDFLAGFPDSHIMRKHGPAAARAVRERAVPLAAALHGAFRPETCLTKLRQFDLALKGLRINPGTSADLTVACLLIARLDPLCPAEAPDTNAITRSRSLDVAQASRVSL